MECSFFFEVVAPNGLKGIDEPIKKAKLDLYVYNSGFNKKNILKDKLDGVIEIGMDTSTTDLMHGSGYIESDFGAAKKMVEKLSDIFKEAGYCHKIGIDDENGEIQFGLNINTHNQRGPSENVLPTPAGFVSHKRYTKI